MTSTLRDRKLSKRFDQLDADGNGFLEWDDFEAHARRLALAFAHPADSPTARQLLAAYRDFWVNFILPMDTDGDGRVAREEFVASVEHGITDRASFDRVYGPHVAIVAALADTDGDGHLDVHEYRRLMRVYGVAEDEATEAFAALDTDGDGFLTVTELMDAARAFYLDSAPDSRGNLLMGRV
ncbi:EF-hand domain-containing protein [Streptomyces sp. 4F14]|uniref:EF-hand domain-containing protein n=1 Tax=Streptomyces sp. 4F14 TaxID=3394380 RepID=UPI003A8A8009